MGEKKKERYRSTNTVAYWAESVTFASTFANGLSGYIHTNESNGASKCSWDCKFIVSALELSLAWLCPGQKVLSFRFSGVV